VPGEEGQESWRRWLKTIAPESRLIEGTGFARWITDLQRRRHVVGSILLGGIVVIPFFLIGSVLTAGRITALLGVVCAVGWAVIVVSNAAALHRGDRKAADYD
jgi:hypothetical protein